MEWGRADIIGAFLTGTLTTNLDPRSITLNKDIEMGKSLRHGAPGYRMLMALSAKCWNGPNRQVDVVLSCGTKNELLSVSEPEKCEYRFKVTSPAMCLPLDDGTMVLAADGKADREEL